MCGSSKMGQRPKLRLTVGKTIIIKNHMCLGEARWGRSPPGRKTQILFLVRHMYPAMKFRESVGRRAKPEVRIRKLATQINTRDLIN